MMIPFIKSLRFIKHLNITNESFPQTNFIEFTRTHLNDFYVKCWLYVFFLCFCYTSAHGLIVIDMIIVGHFYFNPLTI